jgi:hypothetical protein
MRFQSLAFAVLLGAAFGSGVAKTADLPPLNPSAAFDNTVTGGFQDIWRFVLPDTSIVAASITNNEIVFEGNLFGGIDTFAGFIDMPFGADVPLTFSASQIPGPGGSVINVQRLEGNALLLAGAYDLVLMGAGITGSSASYGGNIVATAVPEPGRYAMMLAGLGAIALVVARRRRRA